MNAERTNMFKNKVIIKALEALWESTLENKKKGRKSGAPISAVIFNAETGEILAAETNSKTKKKGSDPSTHAELKCLNEYAYSKSSELCMFITLNPCNNCLTAIRKDNKIKKVFYLIDSTFGNVDPRGKIWITKYSGKTQEQICLIDKIIKNHDEWTNHKKMNPIDKEGNVILPLLIS